METQLIIANLESIEKAADLLRSGEIVGIPTETVYGLAGNALDVSAVKKIFEAKGRPADNPLILHIADMEMLDLIAVNVSPLAKKLAEKFWPGPLTILFERKEIVPPITNGGLPTVAVRMPDNLLTLELIRSCGFPLAAPSANTSGLPSPTNASHVFDDMNGKIPLILDGGSCKCGVESTVVALIGDGVRILRPGAVTKEMLEKLCSVELDRTVLGSLAADEKPLCPGTKYKHYSPRASVFIIEADDDNAFSDYVNALAGENIIVLAKNPETINKKTLPYGESADEEASRLFASLRKADELGAEKVYVRAPQKQGIGVAVYNRLLRAAAFNVIRI